MWFWDTLKDFVLVLIGLLLVCAVSAAIGSIGFQFRRGLNCARAGKSKSAVLRIAYALLAGASLAVALVFFHASWMAWLLCSAPALAGFFGWFLIPGEGYD